MLAGFEGRMPTLGVSSKIMSVESGEVLYHDSVMAMATPLSGEWSDYAGEYELQPELRAALDHALSGAIARLSRASRGCTVQKKRKGSGLRGKLDP